jgi:serine protease AprX
LTHVSPFLYNVYKGSCVIAEITYVVCKDFKSRRVNLEEGAMRSRGVFYKLLLLFSIGVLLWSTASCTPPAAVTTERVIVKGYDLAVVGQAVRAHGGAVVSEIALIDAVVANVPQTALDALRAESAVAYVMPDRAVATTSVGEIDPRAQINVEFARAVGAQEVWSQGNVGEGVTVAVLDSGIDLSLNGLKMGLDGRRDVAAYYDAIEDKFYEGNRALSQSPRDSHGHGTHIAGTIADSTTESDGDYRGIAPGVEIVAVRAVGPNGMGAYSDVLRGINWVVEHKDDYNIRVLNISLYAPPVAPYWADPYNQAVMAAWKEGIVVVASAGNGGPDPMSIGVPGNTPYIITVGTFTDNYTPDDFGDDYIAPFSATGPTLDGFVKPDVIAPGGHLTALMAHNSTLTKEHKEYKVGGNYFQMAGTSMSAAVTSGVAALMLSENPDLTPDEVKYRLTMTARPQFSEYTGEAAYSIWQQGAGRIWAPAAVYQGVEGAANAGMDIAADLAGDQHYEGRTIYDETTGEFAVEGYDSWSGGYLSWAGGYLSWAGGYLSWAGGTTNWSGDYNGWTEAYDSWANGYNSWSGGYLSWAGGYLSWAGGYLSWAGDYPSWSGGYLSWAGGYLSWAGGYLSWAGHYGDPDWAAAYADASPIPDDDSTVAVNSWVEPQ